MDPTAPPPTGGFDDEVCWIFHIELEEFRKPIFEKVLIYEQLNVVNIGNASDRALNWLYLNNVLYY